MTKKSSLQDALLNSSLRKEERPLDIHKENETKKLIVEISFDAHLQIDQMKRDLRRTSMKEIIVESLNDIFKKYGYPPLA